MLNEKLTPTPTETLSPREARGELLQELVDREIGYRAIGLGGLDGEFGVRVTVDDPEVVDLIPRQRGGVPIEVLVDRKAS